MILSVNNPLSDEIGRIKPLTIEDFRSISFIIENATDRELEEFLESKFVGEFNAMTKLLVLMQARMKFVSEQISFNNGTASVTIDLKYLWKELFGQITSAHKILMNTEHAGSVTIDYPTKLIHVDEYDLIQDCIVSIDHPFKSIKFKDLSDEGKKTVVEMLPASIMSLVRNEIKELSKPIQVFKARANLPDIYVSLFDNSGFAFIRALFNYYTYDDITELTFMLSKRIPDLQYINSRTPRDLELLIRLYTEEIEKANSETKS